MPTSRRTPRRARARTPIPADRVLLTEACGLLNMVERTFRRRFLPRRGTPPCDPLAGLLDAQRVKGSGWTVSRLGLAACLAFRRGPRPGQVMIGPRLPPRRRRVQEQVLVFVIPSLRPALPVQRRPAPEPPPSAPEQTTLGF